MEMSHSIFNIGIVIHYQWADLEFIVQCRLYFCQCLDSIAPVRNEYNYCINLSKLIDLFMKCARKAQTKSDQPNTNN